MLRRTKVREDVTNRCGSMAVPRMSRGTGILIEARKPMMVMWGVLIALVSFVLGGFVGAAIIARFMPVIYR